MLRWMRWRQDERGEEKEEDDDDWRRHLNEDTYSMYHTLITTLLLTGDKMRHWRVHS